MNQGALYATTQTIDTYVYRGLLQLGNISMSAAAGFYQSVIGFALLLAANAVVRRLDAEFGPVGKPGADNTGVNNHADATICSEA